MTGLDGRSTGAALYQRALAGGGRALGVATEGIVQGAVADLVSLAIDEPALLCRSADALIDPWLFASVNGIVNCVLVGAIKQVERGRHRLREQVRRSYGATKGAVYLKEKNKRPVSRKGASAAARTGRADPTTSLHQRILSDIQGNILSGRWEPGRRIPVELELMEQYDCSRMTVNKVLTQLAHAGIIERRRKIGSFVRRPHSQSAVLSIPDIKTEVDALGLPYRFEILERHKRRATREDRALLSADEAVSVLELVCRHFAKDQPFCIEHRLINLQAVATAATESFEDISPGAWLLRQVPWNVAEHRIRASGAVSGVAAQLKIKPGSPCLIVERTTRNLKSPITFVRLTYPGNLHELVASFTSLTSPRQSL